MKISDIISSSRDIDLSDRLCILSFALSMKKEEILSKTEKALSHEEVALISRLIDKRRQGMPMAYITKRKEFYSEEFYIDDAVLIPRPETEILVEEAINILKDMGQTAKVIDVGTGSGAIGIIISQKTGNRVICVDISFEALKVALINRETMGLWEKVEFVCSDLLNGIKGTRDYDMIVANLPYISGEEWEDLMVDVKAFEPKLALYGGKDGTEIYKRLISILPQHLKTGGVFLCEVGGRDQAETIKDMLTAVGFKTYIKKDYRDIERVVVARWTSL